MSQRADYSHTSDCSSFEIANPCLWFHSSMISKRTLCVLSWTITLEARASIRVDNSLGAFACLWAILRLREPSARSQIRLRRSPRISNADKEPRLAPGLLVVRRGTRVPGQWPAGAE